MCSSLRCTNTGVSTTLNDVKSAVVADNCDIDIVSAEAEQGQALARIRNIEQRGNFAVDFEVEAEAISAVVDTVAVLTEAEVTSGEDTSATEAVRLRVGSVEARSPIFNRAPFEVIH